MAEPSDYRPLFHEAAVSRDAPSTNRYGLITAGMIISPTDISRSGIHHLIPSRAPVCANVNIEELPHGVATLADR